MSDKKNFMMVREMELVYKPKRFELPEGFDRKIDSSRDLVFIFKNFLDIPHERFMAIALNAKNRPIGYRVWDGGLTSCAVSPADIFRSALLSNASAIVLMHNHPSGDSTPSADDVALTERLVRCGQLLGIRVIDHIVVAEGEGNYFSFVDHGLLNPNP